MNDKNAARMDDETRRKLQFSMEDSEDFQLFSTVTPEGLPLLTITGKVMGIGASVLTDRVCDHYADIDGNILMDLHQCTFFSSIALGFIYNLADQRQQRHGRLVVIGAGEQIRKMIYMMAMGEFFVFVDSFQDALEVKADGC